MNPQSSIKVKLLSNGRYTWEINVLFDAKKGEDWSDAVTLTKSIDSELRDEFPDHPIKAFGRTVELED